MSLLNQALLASLPERLRPRCSTACAERLDERPNHARYFCDGPSMIFRAALAGLKRPPPSGCNAPLCRNCATSIDCGERHYCPTCRRLQFELTRDGLPECWTD